eukprot:11789498-Alexandrium_andersonii.AAC.1
MMHRGPNARPWMLIPDGDLWERIEVSFLARGRGRGVSLFRRRRATHRNWTSRKVSSPSGNGLAMMSCAILLTGVLT